MREAFSLILAVSENKSNIRAHQLECILLTDAIALTCIQKQKLHNPTMMEIAIYISSFANLFFYISGENNLLLSVTYWLLFKLYMIFPGQHHNPFQCIKSFPWLIEILWWIWSFNTWCELSIQHLRTLITWRFLAATQYSLVIIYRVNTFLFIFLCFISFLSWIWISFDS